MLDLISKYDITVLYESDELVYLSDLYLDFNIILKRYLIDSFHISGSTIYNIEAIIIMNFAHIMRNKPRHFSEFINKANGYNPIDILSPMEIVENETSYPKLIQELIKYVLKFMKKSMIFPLMRVFNILGNYTKLRLKNMFSKLSPLWNIKNFLVLREQNSIIIALI
jgi:hypothetical protein